MNQTQKMKIGLLLNTVQVVDGCYGRHGWLRKSLRPSKTETGSFTINFGKELIWCRKRDDGFPDVKTLKQRIRDFVAPEKDLGHSDREKTN